MLFISIQLQKDVRVHRSTLLLSLSLFLDFLESSLPCTVASRLLSYFPSPWWPPTTSCFPSNIPFRTRGRHEAATRERKREKDGWSRFESVLIHVFFFLFPFDSTFNSMRDQFRRSYLIDHWGIVEGWIVPPRRETRKFVGHVGMEWNCRHYPALNRHLPLWLPFFLRIDLWCRCIVIWKIVTCFLFFFCK